MRHWTAEERAAQAEKIREHKPWKKAGVKTAGGKLRSSRNAYKHGGFTAETKAMRLYLRRSRQFLKDVKAAAAGCIPVEVVRKKFILMQTELTASLTKPSTSQNELIRNSGNSTKAPRAPVIPAQAGVSVSTYSELERQIPAFSGMTTDGNCNKSQNELIRGLV